MNPSRPSCPASSSTAPLSRRAVLGAAGLAGAAAALPVLPGLPAPAASAASGSRRAVYHFTPPSGWMCDPQRPVTIGGTTHHYYLHSDVNNANGWWQHATTTDQVRFTDAGVAIPLSPSNFPVWTGSLVVDEADTAGFGAGAVVALATQPTGGDRWDQEQYLYWSTDDGSTFTRYGAPVIDNPDGSDWFRDPKIHWDGANARWVAVIGRLQSAVFYTSTDLLHWTYRSTFAYTSPNIGGFECPDLFEMEADDGSWHWVLGASMQGDYSGLSNTFAYWTGWFDGSTWHPDQRDPQWLDRGLDWYAAVTWPSPDRPRTVRHALAWMNNWQYAARDVPTDVTDGYNGQMSITRELRLVRQPDGRCTLLSQPIAALSSYVSRVRRPADRTVTGSTVLAETGEAYRLQLDVAWDQPLRNVGISVGRSADGARHTDIGVFGSTFYVDRGLSDRPEWTFGKWRQATAPFDPGARGVHLDVLVDRQSVEVFVNAGHDVLSQQVYLEPGDTGISFYTDGGSARFTNIVLSDLR